MLLSCCIVQDGKIITPERFVPISTFLFFLVQRFIPRKERAEGLPNSVEGMETGPRNSHVFLWFRSHPEMAHLNCKQWISQTLTVWSIYLHVGRNVAKYTIHWVFGYYVHKYIYIYILQYIALFRVFGMSFLSWRHPNPAQSLPSKSTQLWTSWSLSGCKSWSSPSIADDWGSTRLGQDCMTRWW